MENNVKNTSFVSAVSRAQSLCARQERCSFDIRVKLKLWNVATNDIEKVISLLIKDGFINDERFASMFVRDKTKFNKWGPIKIAQALRAKRISESLIQEMIKEYSSSNDLEILTDLLKRKARSIKAKSPADLKNKLIRFGASRGFEFGKVIEIVDGLVKSR